MEDKVKNYRIFGKNTPFLLKVHKSEKSIKYLISHSENIITCNESKNLQKIAIPFKGILKNHCIIRKESEKFYIDAGVFKDIRVNGKEIVARAEINHGDRLVLGDINFFVFIDPVIGKNNTSFEEILEERYSEDLKMLFRDPQIVQMANEMPGFVKKYLKYKFKVASDNEISHRIGEDLNFDVFFDKSEKKFKIQSVWDIDYFKIQTQMYLFDFKIFERDEAEYLEKTIETLESYENEMRIALQTYKNQQNHIRRLFKDFENNKEELEKQKYLYENYIANRKNEVNKLEAEKRNKEVMEAKSDEDRRKLEEMLENYKNDCMKYDKFQKIAAEEVENIEKIILEFKEIVEWSDADLKDAKSKQLAVLSAEVLKKSVNLLNILWDEERSDEMAQIFDKIKANFRISEKKILRFINNEIS